MKKALKHAQKRTAAERIEELFKQAARRPEFARRYVVLARKMAMRHKVRIPLKWRRRFCKKCNAFLVPGKNCRVRLRDKKRIITCLDCGTVKRVTR